MIMQTVWILTIEQDYEGVTTIGAFASRDGAMAAALAHIDSNYEYALRWPTCEEDDRIMWRIADQFTLTASCLKVAP